MMLIGKSLWGCHEAGDPDKWDSLFSSIKQEGYAGIETICVFDLNLDPQRFRACLDLHGLKLVIQIHTASDWGVFEYCGSCEVSDHVASFRELMMNALQHKPDVINVHSGHDSWDTDTAINYFTQVLAIEKELVGQNDNDNDILVVHETHRQRLLHNPYTTRDILKHPQIMNSNPKLKLNLDISHWVCSCEKTFNPRKDKRDTWFNETLELVASHCYLLHLRFGHPQGPQIPDLDDPSYSEDIALHLSWWKYIHGIQLDRAEAETQTEKQQMYHLAMTEHGPFPYQIWSTPAKDKDADTKKNLTDEAKSKILWDINNKVKDLVMNTIKG